MHDQAQGISFYTANVPPRTAEALQQAALAYANADRAEALLLDARQEAPDALPVYFALYKFYFYRGRLAEAEHYTRLGLNVAARLAGFADNWTGLTPATADWLSVNSPQHFYLFSLKALAFIRLRSEDPDTCQILLDKLTELDPQDTVGASVIRALLRKVSAPVAA